MEPAILENQAKLNACDVVCYTYDSSDPDSFAHIVDLRVGLQPVDNVEDTNGSIEPIPRA